MTQIGRWDIIFRHIWWKFQGRNEIYGIRDQSPKIGWDPGLQPRDLGSQPRDRDQQVFHWIKDDAFWITQEIYDAHLNRFSVKLFEILWSISHSNPLYHMTRTAPRAISLENHKRKGPVWGPYASKWYGRKNTYGPTRNAYGPTRNAYGKIDAS